MPPHTKSPRTARTARVAARATTWAAVALTGSVALAACGSDPGEEDDNGKLSVGVFLPGSITDTGFMQSAHEGVERIREERSDEVDISFVEEVEAPDYELVLTRLAGESDLVVSVGGQTDSDVRAVAAATPDVTFVEIGGPADAEPMDNLAYYDPQQPEGEYLSGVVAALASETGRIGFVGGAELPEIVNAAHAFENGARSVDPDVEVVQPQLMGDFNDPGKAMQAAAANYGVGVDVLSQILNLGKSGLEQAAEAAGAHVIGGAIAPDRDEGSPYVGYVLTDIGTQIEYAIDAVLDDTWEAAQTPFGLTTDREGTDFVLCSDDPELAEALESAMADLASGAVEPY